jgi:hypothetical protein
MPGRFEPGAMPGPAGVDPEGGAGGGARRSSRPE